MPKNTVDNSDCTQPDGQKKSENISRFMLDEFLDYVETSTGLHFSFERHADVEQKLLTAVTREHAKKILGGLCAANWCSNR